MSQAIQKICNAIVKSYKADTNVLGVLLFGSAARNAFDQYSDIDIYILLNKKGKFSRNNFIKNGVRVDIIFNTLSEAKKYLKEDKNSLRRITSHMLAYGVILFQKGDGLDQLKKIAVNNLKLKTKYTGSEILMHKYSIDDFWGEVQRDIETKNYIAFGIDSYLLITNIVELLLKLKGEYLPQPNQIIKVLKKSDKKVALQIINFYKENSIGKKKKILRGLVNYVYKKYKGSLPRRWIIK